MLAVAVTQVMSGASILRSPPLRSCLALMVAVGFGRASTKGIYRGRHTARIGDISPCWRTRVDNERPEGMQDQDHG